MIIIGPPYGRFTLLATCVVLAGCLNGHEDVAESDLSSRNFAVAESSTLAPTQRFSATIAAAAELARQEPDSVQLALREVAGTTGNRSGGANNNGIENPQREPALLIMDDQTITAEFAQLVLTVLSADADDAPQEISRVHF